MPFNTYNGSFNNGGNQNNGGGNFNAGNNGGNPNATDKHYKFPKIYGDDSYVSTELWISQQGGAKAIVRVYTGVKNPGTGKITYLIDNAKCVRCGECINHFDAGCYMRKVLGIKRQ